MSTSLPLLLRRFIYGLGVAVLCVSLVACDDDDPVAPDEEATIADFVEQEGALTILAQALETTELRDTLSGEGPYTLFAPENAAFDELTVDELMQDDSLLVDVLEYHIVSSAVFPSELSDGQTLETLQGDELTVSVSGDGNGDTIRVDGATALGAVEVDNGVAYVVDEVLLGNRTAYERLSMTRATQTLTQIVDSVGLTTALNAPGGAYTIFAPTDDAIEAAEIDTLTQEELSELLQYHAVSGQEVTSADVQDTLSVGSLQGEELTLTRQNGDLVVNDEPVADSDLEVSNGVLHLIDTVLLPPSWRDTTDQDTTATSAAF